MVRSLVVVAPSAGPSWPMALVYLQMAESISSWLDSTIVEATAVNEHIMRLRVKHTLGFMFLVSDWASCPWLLVGLPVPGV